MVVTHAFFAHWAFEIVLKPFGPAWFASNMTTFGNLKILVLVAYHA